MSTVAGRALKERQKNRNLPTIEVPQVQEDELARVLRNIQEHIRMYEGDSGAPKERFVTIAELENAGLVKADVKGRFAYIAQLLQKDVAQKAGSTANPTQTDLVKTDTSRTSRIPSGGSSGGAGATSSTAKLNDNSDVNFSNPANNEFLYYDGNKFTTFPLFKKDNVWFGSQRFEKPIKMREQEAGPTALEGLGYIWVKDDQTLWFTDGAGVETELATGGGVSELSDLSDVGVTTPTDKNVLVADGDSWEARVLVEADIDDFGSYSLTSHNHDSAYAPLAGISYANWDTAFGWGNHASGGYASSGHTHTFASLTSKPTTLAGYGITDASLSSHNHSGVYEPVNTKLIRHVSSGYNDGSITVSSSAPGSPSKGDIWFDTT